MSDLISRSEFLKKLESNKLQPTKDMDGFIDGWFEGFNTVVDMIENQPTAFDTEKVVEQLEERKAYASGCFGVMCSDCKYTEECHEGEKSYKVAFDSAIDIVKKGGVE